MTGTVSLILKIPHSHRYQLTTLGRRIAVLFTKTYGRVLAPGRARFDPRLPEDLARRSPLARAWHQLENALDAFAATRRAGGSSRPSRKQLASPGRTFRGISSHLERQRPKCDYRRTPQRLTS